MPPRLPEDLVRAVENRRCILFVGSGLSSAAGYPTWGELVQRLVDAAKAMPWARVEGIEQIEEQKDWFTLAEFARRTLTPGQFADVLREQVGNPVRPSRAHELIARTDYRGIITTNYDQLLEITVTKARNWMPSVFHAAKVEEMAVALFNERMFVYKLHGDVNWPSSTVISASDYDEMILRNPHSRSFLYGAMLNYTLLFAGYSLRDPDFQLVLRELSLLFGNYVPRHYALIPNAGEFTVDHLVRRLNIHAIAYDPSDDHREVVEVLEELQRIAPYEHAPLAATA